MVQLVEVEGQRQSYMLKGRERLGEREVKACLSHLRQTWSANRFRKVPRSRLPRKARKAHQAASEQFADFWRLQDFDNHPSLQDSKIQSALALKRD